MLRKAASTVIVLAALLVSTVIVLGFVAMVWQKATTGLPL